MVLLRCFKNGAFTDVLIPSLQYFRDRLNEPVPSETSTNQTDAADEHHNVLEAKFTNVMTLCAMLPLLLCTCLNSFLHSL